MQQALDRCLHEAVLAQAVAAPDRPAVVFGDAVLTFAELAEVSGALARRLAAAGVREGTPVASCLPRGLATVTSILGIWLAGGVYVPVDPAGPPRRLAYMLRDSDVRAVISMAGKTRVCPEPGTEIVTVDRLGAPAGPPYQTVGQALPLPGPDALAYVIYTSGTTGHPKGVMVEHRSLAAMVSAHEDTLHALPGARRVALNAAPTFDVFFADLANLAAGRTLFVLDDATRRDPQRLARFITRNGIEVFNGTPTQIRAVLLAGHAAALSCLRILILSGEAIDDGLWRQLRELTDVRVHNFYGPTECTVHVTAAAVAEHPEPVIGTALPRSQAWLVDGALRPVPDGDTGEICVSGPQVARGYLHAGPEDAARFTDITPPGSDTPVRAYRTGDRGRRNRSGQLEFLGRLDEQVSIDGYRVELREVAAVLRRCPGVRDAAVGTREQDLATSLAAWVVLEGGTSLDAVRAQLAATLPGYMMPRLRQVPAIPMRPSGKADLAALSQLDAGSPAPPGVSGQDAGLRDIWCQVLGISSVGSSDDFFALGGNSLKATQVMVAVRAAILPELPIRVLFDHPEFRSFSAAIAAHRERRTADGGDRG